MQTSPFDAAIIDLDGTLIDTVADFEVALNAALLEQDLPAVSLAFVTRTVGKGSEHLISRSLAEVGAPAALFEPTLARYQHHYAAVNGRHARVYAGVPEGLQALRATGLRMVCVTNKPTAFARPLLVQTGLAGFFEFVYGGDAFEHKKPHPMPLLKSCKALGTLPARTLMVGDSSNDAAAARAAGCPVVLVNYGYNHGEPVAAAQPDAIVSRLDEVLALLTVLAKKA
jgi:phosphoglycolate phosphatase